MTESTVDQAVALAQAVGQAVAGQLPGVDMDREHNAALVPEGYGIVQVPGHPERPSRMDLGPSFYEAESLADYVNRFWTANAVAFTDWTTARIHVDFCYLDAASAGEPGGKHWSDHCATFEARETEAWRKWSALHETLTSQRVFIRFLEERAHEIVEPDAASIVDVCMNFEAAKRVDFKSSQRLKDGYRQFVYVEENQGNGAVEIPEIITINVPIFEGQEPVRIKVRMRYDISDGRLQLGLAIDNVDEIRREAFERCVDSFQTGLQGAVDLPIYKGSRD